jgi:hypothetical protein
MPVGLTAAVTLKFASCVTKSVRSSVPSASLSRFSCSNASM